MRREQSLRYVILALVVSLPWASVQAQSAKSEVDLVGALEAMNMEHPLTAHRSGTVMNLKAQVGATVTSGSTLCEIAD